MQVFGVLEVGHWHVMLDLKGLEGPVDFEGYSDKGNVQRQWKRVPRLLRVVVWAGLLVCMGLWSSGGLWILG